MTTSFDIDSIRKAGAAIDPVFTMTPHYRSRGLSGLVEAAVWVKDESRTPIGCFKGRGTEWWMDRHPEVRDIVCASAGNFGQAVAWSGAKSGRTVQVFTATNANPFKVRAMEAFGAVVIPSGRDFDDAKDGARIVARQNGAFFLEDGREPEIAEGAGTIAVEITDAISVGRADPVDVVYLPVGNGALAGGMASWFRAVAPTMQIIGVVAESAPAMALSWRERRVVATDDAKTIADGIAVRLPIEDSLPPLYDQLDDVILVPDSAIIDAMQQIYRSEGIVTEPAGAVSLAGAMMCAGATVGASVLVLITGSNIDERYRNEWLMA